MTDHDHELTDERLARITARVHAGIAGSPPTRSLTLLRAAIVLLVVASAAIAAWAYDTSGGGSPDGPASSLTAPGPEGLARLAAERPYVPIGDGYAHLALRQRPSTGAAATDERWVAADGTGRVQTVALDAQGVPGEPATQVATAPGELAVGRLTPAQAAATGVEVDDVFATLVDAGGYQGEPAASVAADVVEQLAWPGVRPATRAALFRVLADLGYEVGRSADPAVAILVGPGPKVGVEGPDGRVDHLTRVTATFDVRTTAVIRYRIQAPDEPLIDDTTNVLESSVTATPY